MPEKPNYWAVIPATVRYDPELPPNAKLLYGEISSLTDVTGYCFASNAYFEALYELSERTISRLLKTLEQRGYIKVVDADGGSSRRKIYAGQNPLTPPRQNCLYPPTEMSTPPDKNVGDIKKDNIKNITPPVVPQTGDGEPKKRNKREPKTQPDWKPDVFSRFWDLYPRHESKQNAIKAWDKLKPSSELIHEMSNALRRQVKSDEWQRGIGIPYPSTYLNQRRWEDEACPERTPPPQPDDRRNVPWI